MGNLNQIYSKPKWVSKRMQEINLIVCKKYEHGDQVLPDSMDVCKDTLFCNFTVNHADGKTTFLQCKSYKNASTVHIYKLMLTSFIQT